MAKQTNIVAKRIKVKAKNKGVVSKKGSSKNKNSDLYKKPSRGQ